MNTFRTFIAFAAIAAIPLGAFAQTNPDFAPANFSNVIFNGTLTGSTGGANPSGAFSLLFTSDGQDYSLGPMGELTSAVPFTYTKTGDNTATIVEPQPDTTTPLTIALTFTSATGGTFSADYGAGKTQAGTFTVSSIPFKAPLVNMSNRVMIKAGEMAIPGLVIAGNAPRRVLLRAVGPGLAPFGLSNLLPNPTISLWRNQTQIGGNDDWGSDPTIQNIFTRVGAFNLPAGSRDAAMVATLQPGAYTAMVKGSSSTEQGEVLIELYFVD